MSGSGVAPLLGDRLWWLPLHLPFRVPPTTKVTVAYAGPVLAEQPPAVALLLILSAVRPWGISPPRGGERQHEATANGMNWVARRRQLTDFGRYGRVRMGLPGVFASYYRRLSAGPRVRHARQGRRGLVTTR